MEPQPLSDRGIVSLALGEGFLVIVALALGWPLEHPPQTQIAWTWSGLGWGIVATLPMLAGFWLVTRYPIGPLKDMKRLTDEWIVPLFRGSTVVQLAVIGALAGLGEEMLFRGVIQEFLTGHFGRWPALVAASVLFGLAHPITKTYAVIAALIGLYLGGWWLATGNLLVPIVAHGLYDFLALVYLLRK